ncbi:MAG: nicotinate-nucleotide diphosphorylase (carboxylating) [Candidatus Melainabacteria bacterium GWF2_32_7]|nr:MAG: nicotinate-nucleotide diphosphorylase (carboxylating) [Candidatus Melainabacteria bacterium GWF2_32_7]
MTYLPPKFIIKKLVEQALQEDLGHGDITVDSIVKPSQKLRAAVNSRSEGIVCGIDILKMVFELLDPEIRVEVFLNDGDKVIPGQNIATIGGSARAILTGERTALNFIQRMSAIATLTNKFQEGILPYKAKITDTRKTTPNFRIFEKYSVKVGGGSPHRFGLYDAVMIKDNHIELAGSITQAVKLTRENIGHTTKIEVETENMVQVKEAIDNKVDIIMLDNMTIDQMTEAVNLINGRAITEASGTISLETVNQVASTGVNYISTSAMTARAGILDIGLDI